MSVDGLGPGGEFLAAREATLAEQAYREQHGELVDLLAQASGAAAAAKSLAALLYPASGTRSDLERQVDLAVRAMHRARSIVPELERQRTEQGAADVAAQEAEDNTRCEQCGVPRWQHPAGDGVTECPGDFGTTTTARA